MRDGLRGFPLDEYPIPQFLPGVARAPLDRFPGVYRGPRREVPRVIRRRIRGGGFQSIRCPFRRAGGALPRPRRRGAQGIEELVPPRIRREGHSR